MSDRMRKINSSVHHVIANEVEELKDPRLGFVTITGVDTAPNLRTARVFYSVIGPPEQQVATQAALDSAAPRLSRAIGSSIRMKYTPTLKFEVDEAIEFGVRISQKLRELDEEE